jgi:uncharacterized protein (DUF2267 family)
MTVSNLVRLYPLSSVEHDQRRSTVAVTPAALAFYRALQEQAHLPTQEAARRWSHGILRTLGEFLDRPARRALAFTLPPELAAALLEAPAPLHFRPRRLPLERFLRTVALRSGALDESEAKRPVSAAFHLLQEMVEPDTEVRILSALPEEVGALWRDMHPLAN